MDKSILVIAPHGDDEVLGVGGSMQKHIANGDKVTVAFIKKAVTEREQSQIESTIISSKIFGFNAYYLNLPKSSIVESYELTEVFDNLINKFMPERIYCPWYGDMHQEHRIISRTVGVACRRGTVPKYFVNQILFYETPSSTDQGFYKFNYPFLPTFYNKLAKEMIDKKCEAMDIYGYERAVLRDAQAIKDLASKRGRESNNDYAEAFVVARFVHE